MMSRILYRTCEDFTSESLKERVFLRIPRTDNRMEEANHVRTLYICILARYRTLQYSQREADRYYLDAFSTQIYRTLVSTCHKTL